MNKVLNIIIFGGLLILLVIALMPIFGQGIFGRTISYGLGLGDAFYALMSFVAFVVFMILINLKKIKSNLKSKRTVAIFVYLTIIFFSYSFTVGRGIEYAWNGEILYPSTQGQEKNNDYKSSTLELGNGDDVIVNLEDVKMDIIYLKRLLDLRSSEEINALITNGNKFPGTDLYELTAHTESPVYTYPSFQITTVPHEETNGYVITIKNVKSDLSFTIGEEWGLYFQGLIGHYMIIDEGTGTMRDLSVYDLQEQKVVFKNGYVGSLEMIKGKIHFLDQVQIEKESEKPECPQEIIDIGYGIGYVEKLIYDIEKGKMKRTGEYQCWYFE
ncbi:hypothetical protein OAA35_00060 [bacterium]|nr:hypothetical protein [bacterium]